MKDGSESKFHIAFRKHALSHLVNWLQPLFVAKMV
jgi:hypothetical protein